MCAWTSIAGKIAHTYLPTTIPCSSACQPSQIYAYPHLLCACSYMPSFSLAVGASFDAGDQAFVSYGPVSNDDLLQYYGFVERENPLDTYVLQGMGKWLREVRASSVSLTS